MFCFLGIGYATLTDNMNVQGTAEVKPPATVFITNVYAKSGSAVVNDYIMTTVNSTVTLTNNAKSSVTLSITVFNNASETYAYNAVKYIAEAYSNQNIIFTPTIIHGDEVAVGEYRTFDVTFTYKEGVSDNKSLNSVLNFEFLPVDELPKQEEIAVSGALEQFKNIINNIVTEDSLDDLLAQMDDYQNNDRDNASYIGNVEGASDDDTALITELFQGNLKLNIDGVDTDVTILIKRENIDGSTNTGDASGNELTIYMTTDDLQSDSWWGTSKAPVYVAVYSSGNDGETWERLGEMYSGTATIKQYNGYPGSGSFDTDTWRSTNNKTISSIIKNL